MASDHEREVRAEAGDPDREKKAAAVLPFGRLVAPNEAARAVYVVQSIWGAAAGGMPVPDGPMAR